MHQHHWRIWLLALSCCSVCALLPSRLLAQANTGEVEGRVIDVIFSAQPARQMQLGVKVMV